VLNDVARKSGGHGQSVLNRLGVPSALGNVAALITGRYDIAYVSPDSLIPPKSVTVRARDRGHRVIASTWVRP
jgi:hypothetical protein